MKPRRGKNAMSGSIMKGEEGSGTHGEKWTTKFQYFLLTETGPSTGYMVKYQG